MQMKHEKLDIKSRHIWQKSHLMDEQVRPTTQNENNNQQRKKKKTKNLNKLQFLFYNRIFSFAVSYVQTFALSSVCPENAGKFVNTSRLYLEPAYCCQGNSLDFSQSQQSMHSSFFFSPASNESCQFAWINKQGESLMNQS